MKQQVVKMKIGEANFKVDIYSVRGFIYYIIKRNQKTIVNGQIPKKDSSNIKLYIMQHLLTGAIFKIEHELEKRII